MCGQFSLLSLYFYLINFIARHRQAGNYRGTPRCPHAKPLPVVACRSRSRRRFSTLTMTYCRSQAKAQHSPSWDRQGTDKGRHRVGSLSLSACFIGNSFRKVAFLVRFSFSSSVGCLRFACGQILHVNQFISLELKLNQPQRRSLERQRQQFWQLNTNSNFICHLSFYLLLLL